MKKVYLALALFGLIPFGSQAETKTLLNEGFEDLTSTESYSTTFPDGWTSVDSYTGNNDRYRWNIYYYEKGQISGMRCASVDAAMFSSSTDGKGPREEILLTPSMTLDDTYQLSVDWQAASASAINSKEYDFQVRVVVDGDLANAETVWSFLDADKLKECGGVDYPWSGWTVYNAKIDLSDYQGKTVKVAFVYKMLKETANVLYIDNVSVKSFVSANGPKATVTKKTYNFGQVYLGSKTYSDAITLKNEGKGTLNVTSIDYPKGVSSTIDIDKVALKPYETYDFNLVYTSAMTSTADGVVTIHTNGGDLAIRVLATKTTLPEDATFEGFENGCPPAGWTSKGWKAVQYAIEGDYSAYASASLDEDGSSLTTPRLDMSEGAQSISFMAYDEFDSDEEGATPGNDVTLEFSKDGGATWSTVWTSSTVNEIQNVTVDLGTPASDNCYLRWHYSAIDTSDEDNIPDTSIFFLDAVVLPKIYGVGGVPEASALLSPADKATDLYNKEIVLSWEQALFAEGYKLYVGSDDAATNVVNGLDLGNVTTYTIKQVDYATTYTWKVVPYNGVGDCATPNSRTFTTLSDPTVSSFPYVQGFNSETFPPVGWTSLNSGSGYTKWSNNKIDPYEGTYSASISAYVEGDESSLVTPDFNMPAGKSEVSFFWGNAMPIRLQKDNTGLRENPTTEVNEYDACYFEVYADGVWTEKARLSVRFENDDDYYWYKENIDLSEYAGKTIALRWRYVVKNYAGRGVALDLVTVSASADEKASFNASEWNAGSVNYNDQTDSADALTIMNDGANTLKVKSVEFATTNFSSNLAAGTEIAPKKGTAFTITFNAGTTAAEVSDAMTVNFESGYSVSLPVKGNALSNDTRYYNFEKDEAGVTAPKDFTTIDGDREATKAMTGMNYPQRGSAFAYTVQDDDTWNNVFDPVSGKHVLVAISPSDEQKEADDWIISQKMTATDHSQFKFYGRLWNSVTSILPENHHSIEVLVSETSNTDTSSFETVMSKTEMPYYNNKSWDLYTVDLSKYAGKDIYVALRHSCTDGLAAFFDDFYFEGFSKFGSVGSLVSYSNVRIYPNPVVSTLYITGDSSANVEIYSVAGALVKAAKGVNQVAVDDLAAGVYVVKVTTAEGTKTARVIKK